MYFLIMAGTALAVLYYAAYLVSYKPELCSAYFNIFLVTGRGHGGLII